MKFKELIDELEEIIEDASKIPLSGKCMVDKEEIFTIIEQIRLTYPEDIKQAEYVKKERDRILQDAQKEAQIITEEAKNKAAKMVDDSEIVNTAKQRANEIINDAQNTGNDIVNKATTQANEINQQKRKEINDYQDEVINYIVSMLQKSESATESTCATVSKTIDELNKQYELLRSVYDKVSQSRMNMQSQR